MRIVRRWKLAGMATAIAATAALGACSLGSGGGAGPADQARTPSVAAPPTATAPQVRVRRFFGAPAVTVDDVVRMKAFGFSDAQLGDVLDDRGGPGRMGPADRAKLDAAGISSALVARMTNPNPRPLTEAEAARLDDARRLERTLGDSGR